MANTAWHGQAVVLRTLELRDMAPLPLLLCPPCTPVTTMVSKHCYPLLTRALLPRLSIPEQLNQCLHLKTKKGWGWVMFSDVSAWRHDSSNGDFYTIYQFHYAEVHGKANMAIIFLQQIWRTWQGKKTSVVQSAMQLILEIPEMSVHVRKKHRHSKAMLTENSAIREKKSMASMSHENAKRSAMLT